VNEIFRISDDAEDVPEFLIGIPVHVDVRKFVKFNYGGGDYLVKNRVGGKFKGEREMHIEFAPDPLEDDAADESLLENSGVQRPPLSDDFDSRVADIATRAAVAAVEAGERVRATQSAPAQPDPFAFVERSLEIEEKIRARAVRNNPPPAEAKDSSEQFIDMLDRFTTIAERIAPIRESDRENSGGILGGLASLVREVAPHAKSLLPMLPSLLPQTAQTPSPPQAVPNSQRQSPQQPDPVTATFAIVIDGLRKNKRVGASADAIEELITKMPEMKEQIEPALLAPTSVLLEQLSQFAGEDLSAYTHSIDWVEDLKDELKGDGEDSEADESPEAVRTQAA
jgi:hypothetical protein